MLVKVRVQVWQRNSSLSALSGPAELLSGTPATQVNIGKVTRDLEVTLERWYQHKNSDGTKKKLIIISEVIDSQGSMTLQETSRHQVMGRGR